MEDAELLERMKRQVCPAAVRDGFRWLDTEKYGISVTPYFFGASGRVYPLTIEQLHAKSADDLEFDISQEAEDPGYSLDVRIQCHLQSAAIPPMRHLLLTFCVLQGQH